MSTGGGLHRAVERAAQVGCDCVQLFSKNNNQWSAPPLTEASIAAFRDALAARGIGRTLIHDSYLINLASPDDDLWEKSVAALRVELERAALLGVPWVVFHPGSYTTSDEAAGIDRVIAGLDRLDAVLQTVGGGLLLETTAGQGTNLGRTFEQLGAMLDGVRDSTRLGVCVDTCHIFAAGYPLGTPAEYAKTFAALDAAVGLGRIRAFHLNDSVKGLGSRVDRHADIGGGMLGLEPFRLLLADPRFADVPMYLETPKGTPDDGTRDRHNLSVLRDLLPK